MKKQAPDAPHTEQFAVRNRWSGDVQFTATIECDPLAPLGVKIGLAVKWAISNRAVLTDAVLTRADLTDAVLTRAVLTGADLTRAVLTGADLTDADLTGADLTGADLTGADLTGADLTGAVLTRETLRSFKADHWLTLSSLRCGAADAGHLIAALREGKIDGSTYGNGDAECSCLVGTIAHGRGLHGEAMDHSANRPAERWFMMISAGDKAGDATGGGFAAQKALEWTLEWCDAHGINPDALAPVEPAQPDA